MRQETDIELIYRHLYSSGLVVSQKEFGDKLGYKPSFTSRLVSGKEPEPKDLRNKLSESFGITDDVIKRLKNPDTAEKQHTNDAVDIWKDKYIASLEEQKTMIREIAEAAAKAAVDRLAVNYATKKEAEEIRVSLEEYDQSIDEIHELIESLEQFAAFHGGALTGKTPKQIEGILHGIREQRARDKKKHRMKPSGN